MDSKSQLEALSRSALKLHKALLDFQKSAAEAQLKKPLTPHEVLHLTISHPDFAWLRKLSTLIVRIDETTDDKDADLETFKKALSEELKSLFSDNDQEADFKSRLKTATEKDAHVCLQFGEFKKHLNLN